MNRVFEYMKYYFKANTVQTLHSPFIFDFTKEVVENQDHYYAFEIIEKERKLLLKDKTAFQYIDSGAGSKKTKEVNRSIAEIAKNSLSKERQCRQIFHLARWLQANTILELGTSLGISTLYLSAWNSKSQVHSLEAAMPIAVKAQEIFSKLNRKNILTHIGTFDQNLPSVLSEIKQVDLAFIDGHHEGDACINYFHQIMDVCHNKSAVIIDDIYWSESMLAAWNEIRLLKDIRLSIDLFHYGVVFFSDQILEKQHIQIIPKSLKPFEFPL